MRMSISARIEATIESWTDLWKERLRGWAISVVSLGLEALLKTIEKAAAPVLKPIIKEMEETGEVPEGLKPILEELKEPVGAFPAMLAMGAGFGVVGGAIGMMGDAMFGGMARAMMEKTTTKIMDVITLIATARRLGKDEVKYYHHMAQLGFDEKWADWWWQVTEYRFDPGTITRVWLRDKPAYEKFWEDLRAQGWDEDRINVAKELAKIIPPLADMVRFADYSSFDPEVIAKWREFYDAPGWIKDPFALLGVTGEWADKYWFSHWVQPGRFELGEMHRRELIDDDAVKLAYRTMGYSPFWQDLLLELVKAVPTRVDVRRWWDMRTIDEAKLRDIYHRQGYYGEDLDLYVLWTKVYVAFPDLIARWKNGWITEDEVKSELTALGMPAERVEEMIQTKIKPAQPERVEGERDLTKAEVYAGVKKGVINWDEGLELLQDMGYDADEAEFILEVRVGVAEGSPDTFTEFKEWTQRYRKAMGLEAKIPPPELIKAGKALKEAETARKEAKDKGFHPEKLAPYEKAVSDASYRYRQLLTKWKEEGG
jgi:F0F1-type ATP synthase membrane subunit c/vacuolar-type H+-ATPase subunit K